MPYANIHWVKLKLELLNDKRFIFDCDNNQKWLYIGLLLLAGSTENEIPNDVSFIKNRLNLLEDVNIIEINLEFLFNKFPKMVKRNGFIRFKNFPALHNRLKDSQGNSEGNPINKENLDKIIEKYIILKGWKEVIKDKPEMVTDIYKRNGRAAKQLFLAINNIDMALDVMDKMAEEFRKKELSWTLETVLKHLPELVKSCGKKTKFKMVNPNCRVCGGTGWVYNQNKSGNEICKCRIV